MNSKHLCSIRRYERYAHIVLSTHLPATYVIRKAQVDEFFKSIKHLVEHQGAPFTIKYVKDSRVAVMRTLTGEPLDASYEGKVKLVGGWPKWLSFYRITIPQDRKLDGALRDDIRCLLTLLSSLRGILLQPVLDISPITDQSNPYIWEIPDTLVSMILFRMGIPRLIGAATSWSKFHFTTKHGPNGPALLSSLRELTPVLNNYRSDIATLGGKSLVDWLEILESFHPLTDDGVRLGKLAYFSDKEGKTRVVAMVDYWSQTVLKPVHQLLMRLLHGLKTDCTFDQSSAMTKLSVLPGPFYSLDLSGATDRMPFWLQQSIMTYILGPAKAKSWARLLVERDYSLRENNPCNKQGYTERQVRYAVGQPMGAYSSWASMALTHHFIVQWAAHAVGHRKMFKAYVVLGDDVVIADSAVAESYKGLLSALDMPYSRAKTHESLDSFEFAKRWVISRQEVTPFSIAGLDSTIGRYSLLFSFLSSQATHGWKLSDKRQEFEMVFKLMQASTHESTRKGKFWGFTKLYKLFYYLQHSGTFFLPGESWDSLGMRLSRDEVADVQFHKEFLQLFEEWGICVSKLQGFDTPSLLRKVIESAKRQIVIRDLRRFQRGLVPTIELFEARTESSFPRDSNIPVILPWLPVINCLASLFDNSLESLEDPSKLFKEGIAKFFVTSEQFSQKPVYSRAQAESAVIKVLIDEIKSAIRLSSLEQLDQIEEARTEEVSAAPFKTPATIMTVYERFTLSRPPSSHYHYIWPSGRLKAERDAYLIARTGPDLESQESTRKHLARVSMWGMNNILLSSLTNSEEHTK